MTIHFAATGEVDGGGVVLLNGLNSGITETTSTNNFNSTYVDLALGAVSNISEVEYQFGSSLSSFWFHCDFYMSNFGSNETGNIWIFYNGTTPQLRIRAKGTGFTSTTLQLIAEKTTNGTTWTQLGTVEFTLQYLIRCDFDFRVVTGASGKFQVFRNGQLMLDFAGDVTTQANLVDRARLNSTRNASAPETWASEIIVASECTIDWKVESLKPNAAGTYTEWSGAYTDIDETIYDANDIITTNANNNRFTYNTVNTSSTAIGPREVKGVVVHARLAASPDATPTNFQFMTRTAATDFTSPTQALTLDGGARSYSYIWETNPNTSVKWTAANIDGAEFGLKVLA